MEFDAFVLCFTAPQKLTGDDQDLHSEIVVIECSHGTTIALAVCGGSLQMIDNRVMAIRCNGRILLVSSDKISWVQAARNSVLVHLEGQSYVLKSSLERMEQQLNGGNFVRIHRCTIVNVNHIRELRHWLRGTYQVLLQDGTQLLLSRSYRDHLFNLLGQPLG